LLNCYHIRENDPVEENLRDIQMTEVEGEREVELSQLHSEEFVAPLKIKKVNIGTEENPKIASIGDYCDNQTMQRIT
jgi:hypothetical protein